MQCFVSLGFAGLALLFDNIYAINETQLIHTLPIGLLVLKFQYNCSLFIVNGYSCLVCEYDQGLMM